jgi:AcrR family transcriptional regulator
VSSPTARRRERLRAETSAEIKAIALSLMAEGGPDAIALRAIARTMGMTAGAIYGYYATRDDLITALIGDVYTEAVDTAERARDAVPPGDPAGRITAWARALRDWALTNPAGFRLIYGDPIPGYRPPEHGPGKDAELRACAGLVGLIADAWLTAAARQPANPQYNWEDFDPVIVAHVRSDFPDLPPAALALTMRVWGRMHGLLALEIYGHLPTLVRETASIYDDELTDLVHALGL